MIQPKKPEVEEELKKLVSEIADSFDVDRCSLMLLGETNALEIIASSGLPENTIKNTKQSIGEGISGMVVKEGKSLLVKKIDNIAERKKEYYKTDSFISAPIKIKEKIIGVINITDKKDKNQFEEEDKEKLEIFAEKASKLISRRCIL